MNERYGQRLLGFRTRGGSWIQRAIFGLIAAAVFVLAFFFITIALAAGVVIVTLTLTRWWWLTRRLRAAHKAAAPLEGAYHVVDRERLPERASHTER